VWEELEILVRHMFQASPLALDNVWQDQDRFGLVIEIDSYVYTGKVSFHIYK